MKVQKKKHLAYARKLRHTKIATLSPQMSNDFLFHQSLKQKSYMHWLRIVTLVMFS